MTNEKPQYASKIEGFNIISVSTTVTRSQRAQRMEALKAELKSTLDETFQETRSSKNLINGVQICYVPLNPDYYAFTQPESMTVYHYEHKEAFKRLVSLDGRCDVDAQYMGVIDPNGDYADDSDIYGEARHNIEWFINLCTWFPSMPMYMISWCMNHYDSIDEAVKALEQHVEEHDAFTYDVYNFDNKLDCFIGFMEDYEGIEEIPEFYKGYIDWSKMLNDREGVDIHIQQLEPRRFLVVRLED